MAAYSGGGDGPPPGARERSRSADRRAGIRRPAAAGRRAGHRGACAALHARIAGRLETESARADRDGRQSSQGDPAPLRRRDLRVSGAARSALRVRLVPAQRYDRLRISRSRRGARRPALRRRRRIRDRLQRLGRLDGRPRRRRPRARSPISCPPPKSSASSRTRRSRASSSKWRRSRHSPPSGADAVADALKDLPRLYEAWIARQEAAIAGHRGAPRQATATRLIASARNARDRIAAGIELLRSDAYARLAFRAMNEAVARAARQRDAVRMAAIRPRSASRNGGRSSSPSSCSTSAGCRTRCTPTARSSTCCSSRPAAARPRPISASPPSTIAHRRITNPGAARRRASRSSCATPCASSRSISSRAPRASSARSN